NNAREAPKHHLHAAHTIDATARAIHILRAKTDALDRVGELPEPPRELSPQVGALLRSEVMLESANMGRNLRRSLIPCLPHPTLFCQCAHAALPPGKWLLR